MLCHPERSEGSRAGKENYTEETLRDSSLMLRMTRYYERFAAPKTPKHIFSNVSIGYTLARNWVYPRLKMDRPSRENG